ncbi:hypothetical protein OIO90_001135 [Microbotryomycetes sp. JL221]|nr:hypothetical protein OIO90_001135 [Microbotryomycetes sp. JL221]
MDRFALSRNEEAKILAQCKLDALQSCREPVAEFTACAEGKTVSVAWKCRQEFKLMQACMKKEMTEQRIDAAKLKYLTQGRTVSAQAEADAKEELSKR